MHGWRRLVQSVKVAHVLHTDQATLLLFGCFPFLTLSAHAKWTGRGCGDPVILNTLLSPLRPELRPELRRG